MREQMIEADDVAARHQREARKRGARPHGGASEDPREALALKRLGIRGEQAGRYVFLAAGIPIRWRSLEPYDAHAPDYEDWIDAKTRPHRDKSLIIKPDDNPTWAYLLVCADMHPVYRLIGWGRGWDLKDDRFWREDVPEPAHFIKEQHGILRPVAELMAELRRRQARGL
jgi:hypothetical protein